MLHLSKIVQNGCDWAWRGGPSILCRGSTPRQVSSFATSGDADLGEYDEERVIILKAGRLPPPFEAAGGAVWPSLGRTPTVGSDDA
jgi:hypothetical protein